MGGTRGSRYQGWLATWRRVSRSSSLLRTNVTDFDNRGLARRFIGELCRWSVRLRQPLASETGHGVGEVSAARLADATTGGVILGERECFADELLRVGPGDLDVGPHRVGVLADVEDVEREGLRAELGAPGFVVSFRGLLKNVNVSKYLVVCFLWGYYGTPALGTFVQGGRS